MKKNYDSIDVAKVVLCIFIMLIHLNPFRGGVEENCIYPIVRIAVPLFFVISSYFFFSKITFSWVHDKGIIKRFVLRNLKLYAFWFIVLLPHTIFYRHYFRLSFSELLETIPIDFLLSATFFSSWYIVALIEGVLIVYALSKIMPRWVVVALSALIYVFCCMDSNYYGLFSDYIWYQNLVDLYPSSGSVCCSFLSSMLWLSVGTCIAEKRKNGKDYTLSRIGYISGLAVSVGILYAEQCVIDSYGCKYRNDCYLTLAPLVVVLFLAIKQWNVSCKYARLLRAYSTITFCSHATIGFIWTIILRKVFLIIDCYWLVFLLAVATAIILTYLITRLERLPHLTWLKYAH